MNTQNTSPAPTYAASRQTRSHRRWLFRGGAVLLSLTPLVLFEGLCLVCGWGRPSLHDDPFVGFRDVRPLFVLSDDRGHYEIPASRQTYFCPESFRAVKPEKEFRVVCLGGSTVQGRPFAIETSFTTWLELSLQAVDPDREWEVVNCGGVSYASYRLVSILEEVLGYEPDLIILYTGHNEFLEDRTFHHIKHRSELVDWPLAAVSELRSFTLLREGIGRLSGKSSADPPKSRPILPAEVDALLDYRGGLEEYHWDEQWRRDVIAHYRYNLERMVQMAQDAGVEIILVNPVSNLRDCPPFKSEHRRGLTEQERQAWTTLCDGAFRHMGEGVRDLSEAIRLLERASAIDPQHAGGVYNLAKCYEAAGRIEEAREAYLRAKDLDVCPLRILEPMNEAVLDVARRTGTPVFDAQQFFRARERNGIVGAFSLVDHVHPSVTGHQLIAEELVDVMVTRGLVQRRDGWRAVQEGLFNEHLESLASLYFHKGMDRLDALRGWASGRATLERPDPRRPVAETSSAP